MRPMRDGRKKRLIYAGAGVVALAIPATAAALSVGSQSQSHPPRRASSSKPHVVMAKRRSHRTARTAARGGCRRLFTVKMGEGAAQRIYSGTGTVTLYNLKLLRYVDRCQRNPDAQEFVHRYDRRQARRHRDRVAAAKAAAAAAVRATAAAAARAAQQQASSAAEQTSPVTASAASAESPLPACTWQPESGGNPRAVNPSTGAGGYYQIMPSTWAAYGGTGAPQDAPLAEQTAIAEKIWATQGPSAWVNC